MAVDGGDAGGWGGIGVAGLSDGSLEEVAAAECSAEGDAGLWLGDASASSGIVAACFSCRGTPLGGPAACSRLQDASGPGKDLSLSALAAEVSGSGVAAAANGVLAGSGL